MRNSEEHGKSIQEIMEAYNRRHQQKLHTPKNWIVGIIAVGLWILGIIKLIEML